MNKIIYFRMPKVAMLNTKLLKYKLFENKKVYT